jgi:hypothetical protein
MRCYLTFLDFTPQPAPMFFSMSDSLSNTNVNSALLQ